MAPSRRGLLGAGLGAALLQGCRAPTPLTGAAGAGEGTPRLLADAMICDDGARLPMQVWPALGSDGAREAPSAVIVGLHGMDDYSGAFTLPGPYWAEHGVTTYAYDQRGFGGAPDRGRWAGQARMAEDLRTACSLVRMRHPEAILTVVGESMGGAVAIVAFTSARPPLADRLVLSSPAVWGWRQQDAFNSALLWTAAHLAPGAKVEAPGWLARRIRASDNIAELIRMGRDRRMVFSTRVDTIYGLVDLMEAAFDDLPALRAPPTLYQYGGRDEIIPRRASLQAARRLPPKQRTAYYPAGWHLLLRDLQRKAVLDDILAFTRDPGAALPSGAQPLPAR